MADPRLKIGLSVVFVSVTLVIGLVPFIPWSEPPQHPSIIDDIYNQWVITYPGNVGEDWLNVVECKQGGFALAYSSWDTGARVIRVDENGSVLWQKDASQGQLIWAGALCECQNEDLVITGFRNYLENETPDDSGLFVARMSHNGTVLWHKVYHGFDTGDCVVERQNGDLAIAVMFSHLVCMNSNGSILWNKTYGNWDISWVHSLVECDDGGLALTGTVDIEPSGDIDYRAWLVRTDADGVMQWNRTYGDSELNGAWGITKCSDGGFALVGEKGSSYYWPRDFWIVRTSYDGSVMWDRTYCNGLGHAIVECPDGGLAAVGTLANDSTYVHREGLFVRTDVLGNPLWSSVCSSTEEDRAFSVVSCRSGGFMVAGWTVQGSTMIPYLWRLVDSAVPVTGTVTIRIPATSGSFTGLTEAQAALSPGSKIICLILSCLTHAH